MMSSDEQHFPDEELLALSGLQHLAYCERQWGLIHLEGQWVESDLTADGRILHGRTDVTETEVRGDLRVARGLRLRSLRLGLVGRADVVEFHRVDDNSAQKGIRLEDVDGLWTPLPVEYKRGEPKPDRRDEVQLCAQALCLEEMLGVDIDRGALFYGKPRRRQEVELTVTLRDQTERMAMRLHELVEAGRTPPPTEDRSRCRRCSLRPICLPKAACRSDARRYLNRLLNEGREKHETPP